MSTRWADDHSSDEESIDQEEEEILDATQREHSSIKGEIRTPHVPQEQGPEIFGFVSSVSSSVSSEEIEFYFEQKGCNIVNFAVKPADDVRFVVARIGFADHESLDIFLKSDGDKFKGNSIHTSKTFKSRSISSNNQGRGGRHASDVGGYGGRRGNRGSSRDDNIGFKRNDVRGRGGNIRSGREVTVDVQTAPPVPAVRPKLVLQPRTLPIENIGKVEENKVDIFGGGKAHDDLQYEQEVRQKHNLEVEKDGKTPVTGTHSSESTVVGDTVFQLDALKTAVGNVSVADDAVSTAETPNETKVGRGHSADRGVSSGKWSNRTGSGMAFEGGGRGGRGHSNEGGRGRGGRGPPRYGPDTGVPVVTRTDTSKHSGYIIEKPKDEDSADKHVARNSSKTLERRGAGTTDGSAKGTRTKTGGSSKLFANVAQQANLLKSKTKAGGSCFQGDIAGSSDVPAHTALTEEQKFLKAQEKIAQKERSGGGLGGVPTKTKKVNAFAALTGSDSEDA